MSSSKPPSGSYQRRFAWLAGIILAVIAVYTGAWFYAARTLEEKAGGALADINDGRRQVTCQQPEGRGYPFRIGLFCSSVGFRDVTRGVTVTAGAFRTAAQVYAPRQIVGELDGPLTLELAGLQPIQAGWSQLRASTRLADLVPERVSVEATDLIIAGRSDLTEMVRARSGQFHMRPNSGNLDVAFQVAGLTVDPGLLGDRTIPPLDAAADIDVAGGMAAVLDSRRSLRGQSATLRNLSLSTGEGASIRLSGPVSVGDTGLLNAELSIAVSNAAEIARVLGIIFPESEQQIASVATGLGALGNAASIPIRIVDGRIFLGIIPTGRIAPID